MNRLELIAALAERGISCSPALIRDYIQRGLVPEPLEEPTRLGRGYRVLYLSSMSAELYASAALVSEFPRFKAPIAKARQIALVIEAAAPVTEEELRGDPQLVRAVGTDPLVGFLAGRWLELKVDFDRKGDEEMDDLHNDWFFFGQGAHEDGRRDDEQLAQVMLAEVLKEKNRRRFIRDRLAGVLNHVAGENRLKERQEAERLGEG